MYIKKFKQFISEKIEVLPTDRAEDAANKNKINKIEKDVKDYVKFKTQISNIYKKYNDPQQIETELLKIFKLMNQEAPKKIKQFVDALKQDDNKMIMFPNDLIGSWIELCRRKKNLEKIEAELSKLENDSKQEEKNLDSDTGELSKQNIDANQERIKNKENQISKLETDIVKADKKTRDKLNLMKRELNKELIDYKKDQEARKVIGLDAVETQEPKK
jgi:hypothetical protein